MADMDKQAQLVDALMYLVNGLVEGRYGKGDDIEPESFHDDLMEVVEDDIPRITGYGA